MEIKCNRSIGHRYVTKFLILTLPYQHFFWLRLLFSAFHKSEEQITEEQEWVKRAQQNPDEFSRIYEHYFEHIFLFIHKRIMNEEITSEITSKVFYKALYNLKKYRFKGLPFSAWLYRIASNEVAEHYRKLKTKHRHISLQGDQLIVLVQEISEEDNFEEQKRILMELLGRLKEKEIQLIEMRFFENRSFREIGEILNLTENNAKVKTFRVIQKMRNWIS